MNYHNPAAKIGSTEKAVLHIMQSDLNLSREAYEDILGVKSSTMLTYRAYWAVLDAVKASYGWHPKPGKAKGKMKSYHAPAKDTTGRVRTQKASASQQEMIVSLWEAWATNKSHEALRAWLKRMKKVEDVRWLDAWQAEKLIESMKKMLVRDKGDGWWNGH